jgi:hypothetical protein
MGVTSATTAVGDLLVYCTSGRCHHSATMNADWLPDETPVRSLCSHGVHALRNDGRRIFGRIGARTSTSPAYMKHAG